MKNLAIFIMTSLISLSSCGGIKTSSAGLDNESFLEFMGPVKSYPEGVDVTLDGTINFKAVVNKDKVAYMKGEIYAISTGVHTVKIAYLGEVIYEKQIYVASQETKRITLP